jgi:hypothetical protein
MRILMKVTGITQTSDSHLSVHLHGKHGSAQLNLPTDQRVGLNVGSEFTLSLNGLGFAGAHRRIGAKYGTAWGTGSRKYGLVRTL